MTTRVAEGGGGEYGACHYTLAGGVRVPRNLYFSPFPFSFLDPPPTLSSRLSLPFFAARRLRLVARSLRVFGKCPLRPRALLLFPSLAAFSQAYNSRSTCPRRILRISLSCSSSPGSAARRSFSEFPARVTRLQRRAASATTCRHDNTKSIRSIERSLHS